MAYIGKQPVVGNFQKCDAISVVNGQAAYSLTVGSAAVTPENANHMLVSLNGVLQAPGDSFTVSGSTLTFASNLATGDVIDFVIILGDVLDLGTPSDNSISTAKLVANSVTAAKFNADVISGQTALAETPADTDELLLSDAGVLKRIDFSHIKSTPTHVLLSTTNVTSGVSSIDITSNIDSTYKKYMIDILNLHPASDGQGVRLRFYQGGSFQTGSSDYRSIQRRSTDGANGFNTTSAPGNAMIAFDDIGGNESYEHANARIFLNDPSNTTFRTTIGGVGQTIRSNEEIQTHEFAGLIGNTTAVTGFQIYMGSGNIDNAIVKLYGVT
jgi:hypothetical protein